MSSKPVEPAAPPKLVTRAYWLWTVSGALMTLYGIWLIIASVMEDAGGFIAVGVFFVAVGGVLIAGARKVVPGDQRWRSALVMFTLMLVALGIIASFLIKAVAALPLLFSVVALAGSMMAYRPSSEPWFESK